MCYGSVDPRHMMRETEARLKPLAFAQPTQADAKPQAGPGLLAWLRALSGRLAGAEGAMRRALQGRP